MTAKGPFELCVFVEGCPFPIICVCVFRMLVGAGKNIPNNEITKAISDCV